MIPNKDRLSQLQEQRNKNRFSHYFCVYVTDFRQVVCLVIDFFMQKFVFYWSIVFYFTSHVSHNVNDEITV